MSGAGKRGHALATDHKSFGSKFTPDMVRRLASSSVLIVSRSGGKRELLASGTLIAPGVVLCAAHSLQLQSPKDLAFVLFYECDEKTAPKGDFPSDDSQHAAWRTCTLNARKRQGVCTAFLEQGQDADFDYALLAVKWITARARYGMGSSVQLIQAEPADVDQAERQEDLRDALAGVGDDVLPCNVPGLALTLTVPRPLTLPRPGSELTGELLLIGHPYASSKGEFKQCQPTQAGAAALISRDLRNPTVKDDKVKAYAAARFSTYFGASGGGVFNERGELVGVLKGDWGSVDVPPNLTGSAAFLHLSKAAIALTDRAKADANLPAADQGTRLRQWMGGGAPALQADKAPGVHADVDFPVRRRK